MTMKTFSAPIKPCKKPNEHFYLLKFLTPVMVVIIYLTTMSVIAVICDFVSLFRALINITKDDGRSLFITKHFIYQMAPLYFILHN